jgi:ferredoxin
MIDGLSARLCSWGFARERIHTERFAAAASSRTAPIAVPDQGLEVTFADAARTTLWTQASETVLDLAAHAGASVDAACRSGACGSCRLKIVEGQVAYVADPAVPIDHDECLSCIAVPTTRLTVSA